MWLQRRSSSFPSLWSPFDRDDHTYSWKLVLVFSSTWLWFMIAISISLHFRTCVNQDCKCRMKKRRSLPSFKRRDWTKKKRDDKNVSLSVVSSSLFLLILYPLHKQWFLVIDWNQVFREWDASYARVIPLKKEENVMQFLLNRSSSSSTLNDFGLLKEYLQFTKHAPNMYSLALLILVIREYL